MTTKEEWIRQQVIDYDWDNDGFGDSCIEELLSKGYDKGYADALKLKDEMIKSLRDIAGGLYPSAAEEAFIFVYIAKKIANDVLDKLT